MDKIIQFQSQKETQGLLGAQDANLIRTIRYRNYTLLRG